MHYISIFYEGGTRSSAPLLSTTELAQAEWRECQRFGMVTHKTVPPNIRDFYDLFKVFQGNDFKFVWSS